MKSCFVLWSAGVDSTYLILRLLESGYKVRAGYIHIENNIEKTKMEKRAIEVLGDLIEERFANRLNNFEYLGTLYRAKNNFTSTRGIRYRQVPYFINALLVAPITDFRALGYVQGDSAIKNLEKIRAVYNAYNLINNYVLPQLVFPLKNTSKAKILYYMNEKYPDILAKCVWCEEPQGMFFKPCNKCTPCRRRAIELSEANKFLKSA